MALTGNRTFVGFGFGAIQAGLFLYEAFHSGNFSRLVVAEVLPEAVNAIRRAEGFFSVNIAHVDRLEFANVGPLEIHDPGSEAGRECLVESVAQAEEIATAVPSVSFYAAAGPGSIHRILAEGLRRKASSRGPKAVVYAAENHNRAAEILEARVLEGIPPSERESVSSCVRFLNTVIGKMSGVVTDADQIKSQNLATTIPGSGRAFLVEAFNRILVSRIRFTSAGDARPFERGIKVFEEKDDLLPFEEAKLYGHNATHALAAYVGALRGAGTIADLAEYPGIADFLRAAFVRESGEALIRKHAGKDPIFTPEGYREYAEDLLRRMVNPILHDGVDRVGRDPQRKLGWDDRLIGTMRVALGQGVRPDRYALGAAAALAALDRRTLATDAPLANWLDSLWLVSPAGSKERDEVLHMIEDGRQRLRAWYKSGFQNLEGLFSGAA